MPINFVPQGGDVLMCDFGPDPTDPATYPLAAGPCSMSPEMIKLRHVMVLSAQGSTAIVLPFSTVAPVPVRNFHALIPAGTYAFFAPGMDNWFKGDMLTCVSRDRLERIRYGGKFQRAILSAADFKAGRQCALHALAIGRLVPHL